jgi:hypothetical protein
MIARTLGRKSVQTLEGSEVSLRISFTPGFDRLGDTSRARRVSTTCGSGWVIESVATGSAPEK